VLAAECGHVDAMATLVDDGAALTTGLVPDRVDNVPHDALESALLAGQPETAEWLIEHGYAICEQASTSA
jgi:hypothetical protein